MVLRSRWLAVVGLVVVGVVALALLQSRLTVPEAAVRVGIALLALLVVDRVLLPFARALVGEPRPPEPSEPGPS